MYAIPLDINTFHILIVWVVLTYISVLQSCASSFHFSLKMLKVRMKIVLAFVDRFGAFSVAELSSGLSHVCSVAGMDRAGPVWAQLAGFIPERQMSSARRSSKFWGMLQTSIEVFWCFVCLG